MSQMKQRHLNMDNDPEGNFLPSIKSPVTQSSLYPMQVRLCSMSSFICLLLIRSGYFCSSVSSRAPVPLFFLEGLKDWVSKSEIPWLRMCFGSCRISACVFIVQLRIIRFNREQRMLMQTDVSLLWSSSNSEVNRWIRADERYSSSHMFLTWTACGYVDRSRLRIAFSSSSTSVCRQYSISL